MQVGTTKDQGLYNKSSAAVHPGALTAGTLPQYNIDFSRQTLLRNSPQFCVRTPHVKITPICPSVHDLVSVTNSFSNSYEIQHRGSVQQFAQQA